MEIKKLFLKVLFAIILVVAGGGCTKKVSPAMSGTVKAGVYDEARFNWIYVEAIKQKLMGNSGDALKDFEQAIYMNPKSAASYYQIAQIVIAGGDLNNGKRFLERAIQLDSTNLWYLTMMAGIYYQERKIDSAICYYEKAVKFFPDAEDLEITLGNLYTEDKKYDRAISIFDSFDKKYGVNENSTVSAVRALTDAGRYDEALKKAEMLIKEFPEEVRYTGLIAEIYKQKGDTEKAREVYTDLLARNPDNPQIQLAVCDFLISEKDYTELFLLLNNVVLNPSIKKEDKISLFARLSDIPEIIRDHNDDMMIALMVLEANYEDDNIVALLRPDFLVKAGKLNEAADRLEEIINTNPDNYLAWEKLLLVYNEEKDYKKLFTRGEECATKFNRSYLAKILYANAAMELKRFDTALDELRKAEILAGNNKDFMTQVLTMRADVYYRMKDYEKAFETFRKAMHGNSDDLTVINNYAYYLAEQNQDLREAEDMAKKVIEKEKDNPTYLDTYAWVLYKRGKLREAAKIMQGIISSGSAKDAEYYEHYGYILKGQKKCPEAVENWKIAIEIDSTKTELIREINSCRK